MDKIDRSHLCLSMLAGSLLGLAIGLASHWSIGALVFAAWVVAHGLTWGFAGLCAADPLDSRKPISETSK